MAIRRSFSRDSRVGRDDASRRCKLCSQIERVAVNVHVSADQSCAAHIVSRPRLESAQLIERVLTGDRQFPAGRVNPSAGEVTWMIGEP